MSAVDHVLRGPGDDLAVAQEQGVGGRRGQLLEVVGDGDAREAAADRGEPLERPQAAPPGPAVQRRDGLVEHQ
ncbi:MAG: hypothetical protein ACRDK0_00690 [Solirubrobacteraceae bacterium]